MSKFQKEFIEQCIFRLKENPPRITKCLSLLSESEVWQRPNKESNSIGNLILHLCGNIHQYAVASLGNEADIRNREEEFKTKGGISKSDLEKALNQTLNEAIGVIENQNSASWLTIRNVQGFSFSGIGILIHVVEHLSYHTGQIAFYTKQIRNKQVGFYEDIDLNINNELN